MTGTPNRSNAEKGQASPANNTQSSPPRNQATNNTTQPTSSSSSTQTQNAPSLLTIWAYREHQARQSGTQGPPDTTEERITFLKEKMEQAKREGNEGARIVADIGLTEIQAAAMYAALDNMSARGRQAHHRDYNNQENEPERDDGV